MIKNYKPTSPGRRHRLVVIDPTLGPGKRYERYRHLTKGKANTGGRNHTGKITVRHRGGGSKKIVRLIDRHYNKAKYSGATVVALEYCPNMSANLALCTAASSLPFYRLASQNQVLGSYFTGPLAGTEKIPQIGDVRFLKDIPQGRQIHSLETSPGAGAKLVRSAGTYATLLSHLPNGYSIVLLPSKKTITLRQECMATLGRVGNEKHYLAKAGKAGANR
jgi:large subunit ribosomal protein L2